MPELADRGEWEPGGERWNAWLVQSLRTFVGLLAAPPGEQERFVRESRVDPSLDELALQLNDVFPGVGWPEHHEPLTREQADAIGRLDAQLTAMSPGDEGLWHLPALATRVEWAMVRHLAAKALALLDAPAPDQSHPTENTA